MCSQGRPRRLCRFHLNRWQVPKFSGVNSWDQYRQVFDAIVRSNGWDDATVILQLLSHLEGDALNVTLLVLEQRGPHGPD